MSEPMLITVAAALMLAFLGGFVWLFNRLVRQGNSLREAWSGIEVQLKHRHDLIPGLVEVVKGFRDHEKDLLVAVTQSRKEAKKVDHAEVGRTGKAEDGLSESVARLMLLAEQYPEIKADEQFAALSENLVEVENQLQYARRYYNGCARDMNNLVETFPGSMVARLSGRDTVDFFEVSSVTERLAPDLKKQLS